EQVICAHGGGPGAEMFRAERPAGTLGNIGVHVARGDGVNALLVFILEEMLARQVLQVRHDAGDAPIGQLQLPLLSRFALETEAYGLAGDLDMAVAQGGQAKALVFLGIAGIADADEGIVEEPDHRGGDMGQIGATAPEVRLDLFPYARQDPGKGQERAELGLAAVLGPARIIKILLAAAFVTTGSLKVAVGIRTNPDLGPGGRDDQRLDALAVRCLECLTRGVEIGEVVAAPDAAPPRLAVG